MADVSDRIHERHRIERAVEVVRDGVVATGVTEDLSLGGAQVHVPLDPPLRVGDKIEISFMLPDLRDPVRVRAQVRWVSDVDRSYVGVQFLTGLRAKETWALNRFFERCGVSAGS
jgi:hypothetical protein